MDKHTNKNIRDFVIMIDRKVGGAKNVLIKKNDNFVLLFFIIV
jgi:hypothetical protein